jgi:hypothetical protein
MPLDIHIVPQACAYPVSGSFTGHGFDSEHEELFEDASLNWTEYPQLARIRDYWSDTLYAGSDLD